MSLPELPLTILLHIADCLTDDDSKFCFADFNSFLKVNRTLYVCLNRTLWRKAVESKSITECVFKHLIHINDLARLKFFLQLGANVEIVLRDSDRNANGTPLQVAVQLDNVSMARLFLEHGADPAKYIKSGPYSGDAPIHVAQSREMVQLLLDHQVDPEQLASSDQFRPLHRYAIRDNVETMRAILRNGAEVDPRDTNGRTPLYFAVKRSIDAVQVLLDHKADVKQRFRDESTPLHLAVRERKLDVVRLLTKCWPEGIEARDFYEYTPLILAMGLGDIDRVRALVEGLRDSGQGLEDTAVAV
jgi:ankyrin repeat protein